MQTKEIKFLIDQIAEETGYKQTTICQLVLGNAPYYDRLSKRMESDAENAAKFLAFQRAQKEKAATQ